MALKKGDRVQGWTRTGLEHGFVAKAGAEVIMVCDDGKRQLKAAPSSFSPSTQPVPADSPFAKVFTEKRTRVRFRNGAETIEGIVIKGDVFSAKVRARQAEYDVPQRMLEKSDIEVPADPPGPMDAWSVRAYRPVAAMSEETIAFTAEILLDGVKVIDAKNDGRGGCNMYYGNHEVVGRLHADAKAWAQSHGDENPFEAADGWVGWAGEDKPLGVTATEHFAEHKAAMEAMNAGGLRI